MARPPAPRDTARTVASTSPAGKAAAAAANPPPAQAGRSGRRRASRARNSSRPRESHADRADRATEPASGFLVGQALQVAEDDRDPVPSRQAGQPLVELLAQIGPRFVGRRVGGRLHGVAHLSGSPPERGGPGPCRDPSAHPVEPGAQRHVDADGPGPSEQDHEGRLERVLNIMGIVQVASADAQDHRAMALDDRLECRLRGPRGPFRPVVPLQETIEQFRVGQPRGGARRKRACSGAVRRSSCAPRILRPDFVSDHPMLCRLGAGIFHFSWRPARYPAPGRSLGTRNARTRSTQNPHPERGPTPGGTGRSRSGHDRPAMVGG